MRETKIKVINRFIEKTDCCNYTGKSNVDKFVFEFDDEWTGLDKTLVVIADGKTYNVALLNNEAILPIEAYCTGEVSIGVYGRSGDVILASNLSKLYIKECAYKLGEEPSNLPTVTQWDLYITEINNLLEQANSTKEECDRLLAELFELSKQNISEMESIKDEVNETAKAFNDNAEEKLNQYNENAEEKENNINNIAKDVRDMASAITFATFDVEPTTGELYVNSVESLGNMGFSVENDGAMYVEIPNNKGVN